MQNRQTLNGRHIPIFLIYSTPHSECSSSIVSELDFMILIKKYTEPK